VGAALAAKATAVGIGTAIMILGVTFTVAAFGVEFAANQTYPLNELTRIVNVADVLERMDPLFMAVWLGTTLVKVTLFCNVLATGWAQWLGLDNAKSLVLPVGALAGWLSLVLFPGLPENRAYLALHPYYALPIEVGLSALFLALALLRPGARRRPRG